MLLFCQEQASMSKASGSGGGEQVSRGKASGSGGEDALRQRLVVLFFCWTVMGIIWSWAAVIVLACLNFKLTASFLTVYLTYAWTVGFKHAEVMGSAELRNWGIWGHMREYFSGKLHKLADLDPQKTYIFAMVPHGISAISAWMNFATEATGFSELFPGIQVRCATLDANFKAPIIREYCLSHGLRSAGRRSLKNLLGNGPGSAVLLMPGGAAEALLAAPRTYDVLIKKRKGFVKVAIESGACIVPVVAFGETDAFDTFVPPHGSLAAKALSSLKRLTGVATPIFWGVGLLGGRGLLPHGVPLNAVVGAPIEVPQYQAQGRSDERMQALVDEYHAKYMAAVQQIWDEHKEQYAGSRKQELRFVE